MGSYKINSNKLKEELDSLVSQNTPIIEKTRGCILEAFEIIKIQ